MTDLIAYFRVSKDKKRKNGHADQAAWGWSLESQQADVANLACSRSAHILAAYQEIETGKRADRPELEKALAHCRRSRATLVVARLDRLARSVAFTSALMESGVDFVACDNPFATKLTIHILSAVSEDEARRISERTKAALQAAKRRGVLLGATREACRNLTDAARRKGARAAGQAVKQQADTAYADLQPFLAALRPAFSYQQIADILNMQGERTRRGKPWSDVAVMRTCRRLGIESGR